MHPDLSGRIRELCTRTRPALSPGPAATALDVVARRLAEPVLRIGVGGRLKAGKSTLVNAVLGQSLAATATTECTTVVARFRAGPQNRVEVRLCDGTSRTVPARRGGGVPETVAELGAPRESITEIVVEAVNDRLADSHVLVDTPGLDSLTGLDGVSMTALAGADALLYVMPHPGQGDREALRALRGTATGRWTAGTALGVLSRIDELGTGRDPWSDARRLAESCARRMRGLVATVTPLHGLLAETAVCGEFTEEHARQVHTLRRLDGPTREALLYSYDTFLSGTALPIDRAARVHLLALLGMYGLREVAALPGPPALGAVALRAHLRRLSGLDGLLAEIRHRFVDRADRLRAATALDALSRLRVPQADTRGAAALAELRAQVRAVARTPQLRQVALGAALTDLAGNRLWLPPEDESALVALATGTDPGSCLRVPGASPGGIRAAADREILRWRGHEDAHDGVVRRHARLAREYAEALFFASDAIV
ncbi:dynamin family protein [Micromonospora sp. NPDC000207]|uniref:dynamin family protein n=1 Tax=Micromonospora sp. NPDC000207 TaxID=3154246 RepID=UPI00332E541C